MNPAMSGQYDGKYKLAAVYRDQWRGPLDRSISSFGFGANTQFDVKKKRQYSDRISTGILLLNDRTRVNDFNTNHIVLNGAYHKLLNNQYNQYLSLGLNLGITQFGFNYNNLTFGDQFNGVDDYSNPTNELFPPNSVAVGDLSLGLLFITDAGENTKLQTGISLYHFNQPNRSFFNELQNTNVSFSTKDALPMRTTFFLMSHIDINKRARLSPRILWNIQHAVQEINIGTTYRHLFYTRKNTAVHFGAFASIADHLEGTHLNSISGLMGFELEDLVIGFSYEQALDDLSAHKGFGSFEISLIYIGQLETGGEFCPTF
jgi:type IX secretion system PorP/SprF family membrane protein